MDGQMAIGGGELHGLDAVDTAVLERTSAEFQGRWNRLVSTTNWEKGKIISEWRKRLVQAGASVQTYSDDTWSRLVGGVSPQHVGRLRRVHEQFGEVSQQYAGLYWSHFQAALDWHDAEMWLEGAVQSGWSVAHMRRQRWEAAGAVAEQEPQDGDVDAGEMDEDAGVEAPLTDTLDEAVREVHNPETAWEPSEHEHGEVAEETSLEAAPFLDGESPDVSANPPVRPFENLPPLPDDLHDALESLKLVILHHKLSGWQAISCEGVLAVLESLKQLAVAPAES